MPNISHLHVTVNVTSPTTIDIELADAISQYLILQQHPAPVDWGVTTATTARLRELAIEQITARTGAEALDVAPYVDEYLEMVGQPDGPSTLIDLVEWIDRVEVHP